MRSVLLAARDLFGTASAAAPTPATWINLRREMVIALRSFTQGESRSNTDALRARTKAHAAGVGNPGLREDWRANDCDPGHRDPARGHDRSGAPEVPGLRASGRPGGRP